MSQEEALPASPSESAPEVTVQQMDELVTLYFNKQKEKAEKELIVSAVNKEIASIENMLANYLKALNRTDYKHASGTVTAAKKWRVNMPETDADKANLFGWLRERGIFDKYATVNSNSLNSLYMAEWEKVKRESPLDALTFTIPGIGAPKLFESIQKRKGKGEPEND